MWKQTCSPPYTLQLLQRSLVGSDRGKHVLALESFETRHIDPSQISTSSLFTSISPPSIDLSYRSYPTFSSTFIRFISFFFLLSPSFSFPLDRDANVRMVGRSIVFQTVWCTCASHPCVTRRSGMGVESWLTRHGNFPFLVSLSPISVCKFEDHFRWMESLMKDWRMLQLLRW